MLIIHHSYECMCWSLKVRRGDRDWGNHRRKMSQLILHSPVTTRRRAPPLAKQKQAQSPAGALLSLPTFIWDNGKAPSYCHFCSLLGIWERDRKKSFVVYYSSAAAGCLAFKAVPVSIHSFFGNYYKITKKRIRFFQYHNQFLIIDYNFRHRHWLALINAVWMHSTQLCCVPGGQLGCGYLSRMLGI